MINTYQVYISPRIGGEYLTEINVSEYIVKTGIGTIKKEIDKDSDIGSFAFDSMGLVGVNFDGFLSDQFDPRSLFKDGRDRAKVRVTYLDESSEEFQIFSGFIKDADTSEDLNEGLVSFLVISNSAILSLIDLPSGVIEAGSTISQAIKTLFSTPGVSEFLSFSPSNVTVKIDQVIDDRNQLNGLSLSSALLQLLQAGNSVFYVDLSGQAIVSPRSPNDKAVKIFHGQGSPEDEDIKKLFDYRSGFDRVFNSTLINELRVESAGSVSEFGVSPKDFTIPIFTEERKIQLLSASILDEFGIPKRSLSITVPVEESKEVDILDPVALDYPYRTKPARGTVSPLYGVAKYGTAKYPITFGAYRFSERLIFKVAGITEGPAKKEKTLKLVEA